MPLRDHFRPPVRKITPWEALHGGWPMVIVQQLRKKLPAGYIAAPNVHLGSLAEIDVATFENDEAPLRFETGDVDGNGGVATAVYAPPTPSVAVRTDLPDYDEYEVRIYDVESEKRFVAAVEIVSPANKDRAEKRNAFVGKCAAMLQKGVAVSIVDLVTVRHFNLYVELMEFLGHPDPTLSDPPPSLYAVSCRWTVEEKQPILQAWSNPLTLGQPLPTLPLWLSSTLVIPLDLEASYEQACHDLWIT